MKATESRARTVTVKKGEEDGKPHVFPFLYQKVFNIHFQRVCRVLLPGVKKVPAAPIFSWGQTEILNQAMGQ